MKTLKDEIREITECISSPYGEGATYEKGNKNCHLEKDEKDNLDNDLLSAIDKAVRKCVPIELINVNVDDIKTGYKADGFNNCRKQFLDNWEKEGK
jgi:hypothetical protein